jgi:hypothetical protein
MELAPLPPQTVTSGSTASTNFFPVRITLEKLQSVKQGGCCLEGEKKRPSMELAPLPPQLTPVSTASTYFFPVRITLEKLQSDREEGPEDYLEDTLGFLNTVVEV